MFYLFKKTFTSLNNAINEAMAVSRSLQQSDLCCFEDCKSVEDIESEINDNSYLAEDAWSSFSVDHRQNGWWSFSYATCSKINQLRISGQGDGPVYAQYLVGSESGIYASSAAKSALAHGWQVGGYIDWAQEYCDHRRNLRYKIASLRNDPCLEMHFDVHFEEIHGSWHVLSHSLYVNADDDIENVKLVPELASQFKALAEAELSRVFVAPDEYEYNEEIKEGGENSFYAQKFREYQAGLRKLIVVCKELEKSTPQKAEI